MNHKPLKKNLRILAFFLFFSAIIITIVGVSIVSADNVTNLTAESGETWISWTWDSDNIVSINVDGIFILNSTINYYTLSNLNPNERHQLILITNASESFESAAYTKKASFEDNLIYLFLFAILFLLLGLKFTGFGLISVILFIIGGSTALIQSSEPWIIISFWLCVVFSILNLRMRG